MHSFQLGQHSLEIAAINMIQIGRQIGKLTRKRLSISFPTINNSCVHRMPHHPLGKFMGISKRPHDLACFHGEYGMQRNDLLIMIAIQVKQGEASMPTVPPDQE